jgi:hypothetical protein
MAAQAQLGIARSGVTAAEGIGAGIPLKGYEQLTNDG